MNNLKEINQYFIDRVCNLKQYSLDEKPWVFLCAVAFLEYIAKMVVNKEKFGGYEYKQFIRDWLTNIDERYLTFQYNDSKRDLPDQMYHILRCGMVHSFSLIPDEEAEKKGGKKRSIVLYHRKSGQQHLSSYKAENTEAIPDAVVFVAEDFVKDIEKLVIEIFTKAASDKELKNNIESWFNKYPPISGAVK